MIGARVVSIMPRLTASHCGVDQARRATATEICVLPPRLSLDDRSKSGVVPLLGRSGQVLDSALRAIATVHLGPVRAGWRFF